MKEIWKKKKIFVITIALMVGIIGTAATFAIITATAGTVTNMFQAAKVATEIEEEFEGGIRAGSTVKKKSEREKYRNFGCVCPGQDHDLTRTDRSDAVKRHLERDCFFGERQGSGQHCDREYAV